MKNIALILGAFFITLVANSQDLVVTPKGDSINCNITKVKHNNIYFTFKYDDEYRSTLLPISSVKAYSYDFFSENHIPANMIIGKGDYARFRIAVNTGYSYQLANISDNTPNLLVDYMKNLRRGYHFGGDLTFFTSETIGFGVKASHFSTWNSINDIAFDLEDGLGTTVNGKISDDITVTFIAPSFTTRLYNGDKNNSFYSSFAIGYLLYKNEATYYDSFIMKGNSIGFGLDIGYDIGLSEKFSLGFQISLLAGTLTEVELNYGNRIETLALEEDEYESLGRIDLSIGLRFHK